MLSSKPSAGFGRPKGETGEMLRSLVVAAGLASLLSTSAMAGDYKIMIATWRGCEEACRGFQDYLNERSLDADFILRPAGKGKEALPGILADTRPATDDIIPRGGPPGTNRKTPAQGRRVP